MSASDADEAVAAAGALYGAVPTERVMAATAATLYYCHDPAPEDEVLAEARAAVAVVKVTGCTPREAVAFLIQHGAPVRAYAAALRAQAAATGLGFEDLLRLSLVEADRRGDLRTRVSAFRREVLEHRRRQLAALLAGTPEEEVGPGYAPAEVLRVARKHGLVPAPATAAMLGSATALGGEWLLADDAGPLAPGPRP
jgi:hypothetical protein